MENQELHTLYTGKLKTGSKKTKLVSPKPKVMQDTEFDTKKQKTTQKINQVKSNPKHASQRIENDTIPLWVKESSEQKSYEKSKKGENPHSGESKLQWRKETKKSQRSFSKNKERDYFAKKSSLQNTEEISRKPFENTFEKKQYTQSSEKKSSWDKNSVKPGTGFEKSKTGYKGIGSRGDKSMSPHITTRTWDDPREKRGEQFPLKNKSFLKPSLKKDTQKSTEKPEYKKTKYIAPKPTWDKNTENINKKTLKDPTK